MDIFGFVFFIESLHEARGGEVFAEEIFHGDVADVTAFLVCGVVSRLDDEREIVSGRAAFDIDVFV